MANKAVFLDRDGTINVDKHFVHKVEDFEFIPESINGLKKLKEKYRLIIATNQTGIRRGNYTKEDYFNVRRYMHWVLIENGVIIDAEYFCPHINEDNCNCKKPKKGMLEQAAKDFNLNLKECWMIGDRLSDIQLGKNAGCRTIHVLTGHVTIPIEEADFVAGDLVEAAKYISNNNNNK